MRFACSTAAFPEDRLEIAIAKVKWAGYDGVELPVAEGLPPAETVRHRLRQEELDLVSVEAGALPPDGGDAFLEPLARVGRAAAFARSLDAGIVVVSTPVEGELAGVARALRALDTALGEVAADLCLANRRGTLLEHPEAFRELWSCGLPARVGIALDPAHALLAGWDPADLGALPALPRHVYLNDARGGRVVPPGEGELDAPRFARALRDRGYDAAVCVLLENADPWAVEPIAREAREAAQAWFLA